MSDFYHERQIHKTRKQRACYWCGEVIRIGSCAVAVSGQFDGDFWYCTMHVECWLALLTCERSCDGFESYQQRRGLTQDQTEAAQDYGNQAMLWLYNRRKACSRHVLPVELILSPVLGAGAVLARAQGGVR